MSDAVDSHAGVILSVSTTDSVTTLDQSGFEALSYTDVGAVGLIGEYGLVTGTLAYGVFGSDEEVKIKGISDAGNPEIECARDDSDAGQQILNTAGHPASQAPRAFRITKQDGSVDYLRGLVTGPEQIGGGNEDFDLNMYSLGLVQKPLHAADIPPPVLAFMLAQNGDFLITEQGDNIILEASA